MAPHGLILIGYYVCQVYDESPGAAHDEGRAQENHAHRV
jgi:hypothetical protein